MNSRCKNTSKCELPPLLSPTPSLKRGRKKGLCRHEKEDGGQEQQNKEKCEKLEQAPHKRLQFYFILSYFFRVGFFW